jgi:multiple sugar transport system permease protein
VYKRQLFESAELDGSHPFSSYLHIALPLSRPAISAVAVFAFIANWNDFLTPLVYINTNSKYTVSLGLSLFQGTYYTQLHYLMPLSLVAVLPIILIFILAQRYIIQGIITTGLKG